MEDVAKLVCFGPYIAEFLHGVLPKYKKVPGCFLRRAVLNRNPSVVQFDSLNDELAFLLSNTDLVGLHSWDGISEPPLFFQIEVYIDAQ